MLIKTKRNKRSGDCILQNLKYNVKKLCTFHLILVGILSILILSVKNRGGREGGFLNGQNLLSVAKVIFRQSLNHIAINNDVDIVLFDSWPLPRKVSSPVFQFYVYVGHMFYIKHRQGT